MVTRSPAAPDSSPGAAHHEAAQAAPDHQPADIEFRHLRYFAVVAEELHFGRAAARLYITQPGLSQAIGRLERELEVRLFTRTRSSVELTQAGTELLHRGRRLLADLDNTVAGVRMAGRGEAGLARIGVAHLAEPVVAPALTAFQTEHPSIAVDRCAMVSERLLEQLAEGRLHVAVIHRVPALPAADGVMSEPLRRGRLAVLAGPGSKLAGRQGVTLSELSNETFLVNPRSLAPGAFEGLKLMCQQFGGFEAKTLESAVASTLALGTDWRPIRDGTAIAVMAETTARTVRADGIAVVPLQPPPQYLLALAWRDGEQTAAVRRLLTYLRRYRDRHGWITDPDVPPLSHDHRPSPNASGSWEHSHGARKETSSSNQSHRLTTPPDAVVSLLADVWDGIEPAGAASPPGVARTAGGRSARSSNGLSRRELEVLRLLAAGESNAQIARCLGLSTHTVERHVANLYRKIGARGRADATAHALRNGLA